MTKTLAETSTAAAHDRQEPMDIFHSGTVIPAHPLALDASRRLDERRQRALTRYYLEAGAGGVAVAVHTTQFAIHEPGRGLLKPVLELASTTAAEYADHTPVLVAGVCGPTEQAVAEAELAASLGYDLILLAPYGASELSDQELLDRTRAVGEILPVIGFYLQPAVGGRLLPRPFWRQLADIPSVVGVKVAPFDRYATLDVVHGIADSDRHGDVTFYTGNDDHIVGDLLATYPTGTEFAGGLLGQWAVWVRSAVTLLELARKAKAGDDNALRQAMDMDVALTDANAAIFDARNNFHGCIPGIHEVLRRQGLLDGLWCLDENEVLGPGQLDEIERIWTAYPHLRDDQFVAENLDRWLD
ncbi:dihydrodipicolinate synthase family protein [Phytoactinopolyspora alkaliphila]|uniref:Dihydrodipicolinate synthase family protein n=1 Tax=Phytoactinopolyspora alkaliphila TaxID=1783498 RepID=A0A6N9YLD2_9ACTN|nr:dihydrodipicolinate synthase family protein [Phytoactinopolyspora alkaliphila]NED95658.1 dihydrodipicolinate synthase family protein [Phytoactinopolyspora alkaliphila]